MEYRHLFNINIMFSANPEHFGIAAILQNLLLFSGLRHAFDLQLCAIA